MAGTPAQRGTPSERIFAAAKRCFRRAGVTGTTIEDIAIEASMSRATVYRHVPGGRDEIVLTVVSTDVERRLSTLVASLDAGVAFTDRIVHLLSMMMKQVRADPWLSLLFSPVELGSLVGLEGSAEVTIGVVERVMRPWLREARLAGELRADLTDRDIAEWLARQSFAIDLLDTDTTQDPERFEWYLRTMVLAPLVSLG